MKKLRLFSTLAVSILALGALVSCDNQNVNSELPAPETILKEGLTVEKIEFQHIPEEIPIGTFDTHGMSVLVTYSDQSTEEFPLTIASMPASARHNFNVVGEYEVTISFKGEQTTTTFNVVPGDSEFIITYYSYDGVPVQYEKVTPGDTITQGAPEVPGRASDALFKYTNKHWEALASEVPVGSEPFHDYDIYPVYDRIQKRYESRHLVSTSEGNPFRILNHNSGYYGEHSTWFHLGRLERVPLLFDDTVNKSTTSSNVELYFENNSTDGEISANVSGIIDDILGKAYNFDKTGWESFFTNSDETKITDPLLYNGQGFDITTSTYLNNDTPLTLLEGDTSYTPLYLDHLYDFVKDKGEDKKITYTINVPSDIAETENINYYRGAIEGNIDIVVHALYLEQPDDKFFIQDLTYYFLYNAAQTFYNAEYSGTTTFVSSGNTISFNATQLHDVLKDAKEM